MIQTGQEQHISLAELELRYRAGLGDKFVELHSEHLSSCLKCRLSQLEIRDRAALSDRIVSLLQRAPERMQQAKGQLEAEIKQKFGKNETKRHPVISHASKDSYVQRFPVADSRLTAAILFNAMARNGMTASGTHMITTGEFNHDVYSHLITDYHVPQVVSQFTHRQTVEIMGGPYVSVRGTAVGEHLGYEANPAIEWANHNRDNVTLLFKKDERETYHFIVHSASNLVAVCDDFHEHLCERGTTIVYDDPAFCDYLRERFTSTRSKKATPWDLSLDDLQGRFRGVGH